MDAQISYLLKRSLNNDIYKIISIFLIEINSTEFYKGRIYQLVTDRSKSIPLDRYRKYHIKDYMKKKSQNELIIEAYEIINSKKKRVKYNDWGKLFCNIDDSLNNYYIGRCFQFLLDGDNKIEFDWLIKQNADEIKKMAEEMIGWWFRPQEGDSYRSRCYDDDCMYYYYGDTHCECGLTKHYVVYDTLCNLDDVDCGAYATNDENCDDY